MVTNFFQKEHTCSKLLFLFYCVGNWSHKPINRRDFVLCLNDTFFISVICLLCQQNLFIEPIFFFF